MPSSALPPPDRLESGIQFGRFAVGRRPHCVWEWDLAERNLEYLANLRPEYFRYLASKYGPDFEGDDAQLAAAAMRTAYGQALETFFGLACAIVQAPHCVVGWMQFYQQKELEELVKAIGTGADHFTAFKPPMRSWKEFAGACTSVIALEDKAKEAKIHAGYAALWQKFASDFLEEGSQEEYNNLKHGLRTKLGGFKLAIGRELIPGVAAPPEHMVSLGGSEFGSSSFRRVRLIDKGPHFRLQRTNRNWDSAVLGSRLQLLSMSMENLIGWARIQNGVDPTAIQFSWPSPLEGFEHALSTTAGVSAMSFDSVIRPEDIRQLSAEEILGIYPLKPGDAEPAS